MINDRTEINSKLVKVFFNIIIKIDLLACVFSTTFKHYHQYVCILYDKVTVVFRDIQLMMLQLALVKCK